MRSQAKEADVGSIKGRTGIRAPFATAVLALLALALCASTASATPTHQFQAAIGAGEITGAAGTAVDQSNGNLYVADAGAGVLRKYSAAGAPLNFAAAGGRTLGPFGFSGFGGDVAVDNSSGPTAGHFYADSGSVEAFDATGEPALFSAGPNPGTNKLGSACAIAVDSNGDIYEAVYDGFIRISAPSGEQLSEVTGASGPCGVAVDSAGNVYVNTFFGEVNVFKPSSYPVTGATTYSAGVPATSASSQGVAVDPASDNLYTNNGTFLSQYDSLVHANAPVNVFGAEQLAGGSAGVAIARAGGATEGAVYASAGGQVDRFGPLVDVAEATVTEATAITANTATLNGTVNATGAPAATCEFEYVSDTEFQATGFTGATTAPCTPAGPFSGTSTEPVSAAVSGLHAQSGYHFRLAATNSEGTTRSPAATFETVPAVNGLTTDVASDLTTDSATLNGTLNPGGIEVSECLFEYGTADSYGETVPCEESSAEIGEGTAPVAVHADVSGLAAGNHHFRLVATNAHGTTKGADKAFAIVAAPTLSDVAAFPTFTEASLRAKINPAGGQVTYYFEYGPSSSYGSKTEARTLPARDRSRRHRRSGDRSVGRLRLPLPRCSGKLRRNGPQRRSGLRHRKPCCGARRLRQRSDPACAGLDRSSRLSGL